MYNWPKRKNQRLKNFDYSSNGWYFITICTKNRENYFGEIISGEMILNDYGKIAENSFLDLSNHYKNCILDEYIFMPNHFHCILFIENAPVGTGLKPVPTNDDVNTTDDGATKNHWLSEIIRWFKTFSSRNIHNSKKDFAFAWQRSFFDVIIRNEKHLQKTRQYIQENPLKWEQDKNNLSNLK